MNHVYLVGNLTYKPLLTTCKTGTKKTEICIAVNRKRDAEGLQGKSDFVPVTVWGAQAEYCCRFMDKGSKVHVFARLNTYNEKQRRVVEIVCIQITAMSRLKQETPEIDEVEMNLKECEGDYDALV